MRVYKFFDSDVTGKEEYDISGKQYLALLETCFRYCTTVAVLISPDYTGNIETWEKYRIPISTNVQQVYCHYGEASCDNPNQIGCYEIRHYRLDKHLRSMILSQTDSIFKWICGWGYNNPDDLTFFRSDGSVFFSSIIHEGECTLMPNENEDIAAVITGGPWILI